MVDLRPQSCKLFTLRPPKLWVESQTQEWSSYFYCCHHDSAAVFIYHLILVYCFLWGLEELTQFSSLWISTRPQRMWNDTIKKVLIFDCVNYVENVIICMYETSKHLDKQSYIKLSVLGLKQITAWWERLAPVCTSCVTYKSQKGTRCMLPSH